MKNAPQASSSILASVDARTRLAGTNKLELLVFTLGKSKTSGIREHYGINVFKVREVIMTPPITAAPGAAPGVKGIVSLRGSITPVLSLAELVGVPTDSDNGVMIVTEFNQHEQAFLVDAVDTIIRLDWSEVKDPPSMLANGNITAVTELADGRLVQVLDIEGLVSRTMGGQSAIQLTDQSRPFEGKRIFFADDSAFARSQLEQVLAQLGFHAESAVNGALAWERLDRMASAAEETGHKLSDSMPVVITDIEMPEMDGYMLTRTIKQDRRFEGVKVLLHSSISGKFNQELGASVGADGYLPKFDGDALAATLRDLCVI